MSFENFEKGLKLATKCAKYLTVNGKSDEEIATSEKMLNINFSKQSLEFYKRLGYLSFYGNEIYGIDPNDDSGILEGNSVAYALYDRKNYGLPKEWLPIYFFDDGHMGYLDYSDINADGEPPVIMAIYNGKDYVVVRKVAEDLGDFILSLVEEQLSQQ